MKYTEQEFKFDHIFDFIRYIFSSPFLAPFRFINELTRKLPYMGKPITWKICVWSFGFNILLIILNIIGQYMGGSFSLTKGSIPLIAHIVSIIPLLMLTYLVARMRQPNLKPANKETIMRRASHVDEHYFEKEDSHIPSEEGCTEEPLDILSKLEYSEEELNYDNVDNLPPSGISETISQNIELDLSGLEEKLNNTDFNNKCEIPSNIVDSKIQDAINNDEFNIESSNLGTVNPDNEPDIGELNLDNLSGLEDIRLDLDNVIESFDTPIDFSKFDSNFKL